MGIFKSVPLVETTVPATALPPGLADYAWDTMTLGWEDRLKTRARRVSDQGFEFALALPRGAMLRDGDACVLHEERRVIVVREQAEAVFVVHPSTPGEWALWAYHIGNSHQPLMITDEALVCADIQGMEQVLLYHAIPFTRDTRAFTPASRSPGHHGGA